MSAPKDVRGFCLYPTYRASLSMLTDEDRGQLLMALYDYYEGEDTSSRLTPPAKMAFTFIAARMASDQSEYRNRCQQNRENAAKRWPVRAGKETASAPDDGEGG